MTKKPSRKLIFSLGLAGILIAAALGAQLAFSRQAASPAAQASPIHPVFALLDAAGENVLESGQPVSTMQTCGQCHDTNFIAENNFHSDLGMSDQVPPGQVPGGQPWDTSPGGFGKWNALTYRLLSPAGDEQVDLDAESWVKFNASRVAGGGPAASSGVELNCFLCHTIQPDNAARIDAIQSGQGQWAGTAALLGSGIVQESSGAFIYNPDAFTEDGKLADDYVKIQDPTNDNCGQCHGLVHTDLEEPLTLTGCSLDNWQTATTGQVVSPQKMSISGMNLADKNTLDRSFDIHAERGVKCTDCHYSLNNPAYYQESEDSRPGYLEYDPRRLEIGEYLEKPDHNLARGQSAQANLAPELKGTMRRCESCHDVQTHSDWLPYVDRHMQEVACETCHIPEMKAPAVQAYDWTVLQANGEPLASCRGVDGQTGTLNDLVTGFQPAILQRTEIDGHELLAPYNLVSAWYWVYDDPAGARPVRLEDLQAAYLDGAGGYQPEVIAALDQDGDGDLTETELRLDTAEKQAVIAGLLSNLGLQNPRIQGEVQPYSINHNVAAGDWATSDCETCHSDDSRLASTTTLSSYLPGGVLPVFAQDTNAQNSSGLYQDENGLHYQTVTSDHDIYVLGHNRVSWIDWFGALFFVGVLLAVAFHGGLRLVSALRNPVPKPALKKVYMYEVYERFWHWLQTTAIVLLLFTGLIIHRPDIFGFMSFRYVVTLHNVLAAVLVINAALSLFYHLVSGQIRQYIPRPYGFFDQAIVQAKYYVQGIFKHGEHPFEKIPEKKLNPLQQVTYFGILNVLLPLQIITGILMWGLQRWPDAANALGGLIFLAPFHSLVAWMFAGFIVAHVYLTTTGPKPLTGIEAMITGWEEVEQHGEHEETQPVAELPEETGSGGSNNDEQPLAAPAD